jgi:hypothetical protein
VAVCSLVGTPEVSCVYLEQGGALQGQYAVRKVTGVGEKVTSCGAWAVAAHPQPVWSVFICVCT